MLSFPFALRYRLAYDKHLCSAVLTLFLRSVFASLRRRARDELGLSARHFQCGSVTMIQPFGDALRLNLHFHALILDGLYVRDPADPLAAPRFHALSEPDDAEVADVLRRFAKQLKKLLQRSELLSADEEHLELDSLGDVPFRVELEPEEVAPSE